MSELGPWALLMRSESAVVLAGVAFLAGYVAAAVLLTVTFWERLRSPKEIARLRRIIDEQSEQIGGLYQQANRLALQLAVRQSKEPAA